MAAENKSNILICPNCQGNGFINTKPCPKCQGMSAGFWLDGLWLYADLTLSSASIALDKWRRGIETSIDYLTYIIGSAGLIGLFIWLFFSYNKLGDDFNPYFWTISSPWLLLFWISLIFDLFIAYRRSLKRDEVLRIKPWPSKKKQTSAAEWPSNLKNIKRVNVCLALDLNLQDAMADAYKLAHDWKHHKLTPLHLFAILASKNIDCQGILGRLKINSDKLFDKLGHQLSKIPTSLEKISLDLPLKKSLIEAYINAYQQKQTEVSANNIITPTWSNDQLLNELLYDLEIDYDKLNNVIIWLNLNKQLIANYKRYRKLAVFKPSSNMDRAYTAVETPLLNRNSFDLTLQAKLGRLDVCVGRKQELDDIFNNIISGRPGMVLVGEKGVGKSEIIAGLAQLMVTEDVPKILWDKRLLELDVAALIGGSPAAVAQERFMIIANEIMQAGNIVLVIPDIENLTGLSAGEEGSLDLSEILVNAVSRSGMICIGTSVNENYRALVERSPIGQNFPIIEVSEPEGNQAIQIIESKISWLESKYKIYFSYESIADAVSLSSRYMHDRYLPEKAIDILEKTAVSVAGNKGEGSMIESADIASEISRLTHINITKVGGKESQELLHLEEKMHERMVGQEEAVNLVSQSLRRARVELREGKRPIASFLFLGPTGVGKTELAKTLSAVYFGREDYMVRVDMSEYQSVDALSKMIGTSDRPGYLTEKVRQLPFTLILLDEIEKAHPDILNLFLQVFDDGRLTDGHGRTIDFTNTIIIATSNIGAVYIQEEVKKNTDMSVIKQIIIDKYLVEHMRPELINRFDGIVVFKPLSIANVAKIAGLMMSSVAKLLADKGISLVTNDKGLMKLAELGYQPEFGARPLRRLVQDRIENNIANKILAGELSRRDQVIINDQAEIEIKKATPI